MEITKSFIPTSQLELSIACRKLANLDTVSKSDPCCIVFIRNPSDKEYRQLGKTETISDNLNPDFVKKFILNYNFEVVQKIKVEVWDIDLVSNDFIGEHETTIAQIVANPGREYRGDLKDKRGKKTGILILVAEEIVDCKKRIVMSIAGCSILGNSFFCRPKTFLTVWRSNEDGTFTLVYRTETSSSTHNPQWKKIELTSRMLCNGDFDRNIKITCMNYQVSGDHKIIGCVYTTLNDLTARGTDESRQFFDVIIHP